MVKEESVVRPLVDFVGGGSGRLHVSVIHLVPIFLVAEMFSRGRSGSLMSSGRL